MKCSFCDEEIKDVAIILDLQVNARRLKEDETWEKIPNMDFMTHEEVCQACFAKFSDTLVVNLNKKKDK